MEIQTAHPALPFPWDWFTEEGPTAAAGLRLDVSAGEGSTLLLKAVLGVVPQFADDAATRDGFGALGLIALPVNTQVDPAGGGNASAVRLYSIPSAGGPPIPAEEPANVPVSVTYHEAVTTDGETLRVLEVLPRYPMAERTPHLLVVTTDMVDVKGDHFQPSPMSEAILGLRDPFGTAKQAKRMAELRDRTLAALAEIEDSPPVEEIAAAVLFTVGTMTEDMRKAAQVAASEQIELDLDPDGDGFENIFPPSEYPPFAANPPAEVGLVVDGRFRAPDLRDAGGYLGSTPAGPATVNGYIWRDFFILLPSAPASGPYQMITFQHGLDSKKESELGLARQAAQRGMAAGGFDFLHHGKNESGGGFVFIQIDGANKTSGNFRQSALDILSFVAAVERVAEEHDLDGDGKSGADGESDLDMSSIVLAGHSLGALESSIAATLSDKPRAAGLIAGGGNFSFLFEKVLEKRGLLDLVPMEFMTGFRLMASHLMSNADPAAYAPLLMSPPAGMSKCPFLLLVVLEDGTIPEPCAEAFTLAAAAPIILPAEQEWPFALLSTAAETTFGTVQFHGDHEFIHGGSETGETAREMLFHYVETFFASGTPEIQWPSKKR